MTSFSASEPSHQWTLAGLVRAAICSTQLTRSGISVGWLIPGYLAAVT
jgi:hypothetical protein